jgi:cell division protease FtsH
MAKEKLNAEEFEKYFNGENLDGNQQTDEA